MLKRWVQVVRLYLASVFAQCSEHGTSVAHGGSKADSQGQEDHKTKPFDGTHDKELATTTKTSATQTDATRTSALSAGQDAQTAAQGIVQVAEVAHGESNTHTQPHAAQPCALSAGQDAQTAAQGIVQGAEVAHGESNTHTQPHATQPCALSAEQDVQTDDGAPAGVDGTRPLGTSPQHSAQKRGACTAPAGAEGDCKRHCPSMSC
jgi:hypothetical protein